MVESLFHTQTGLGYTSKIVCVVCSTKRVVKSYALANFASPADVIEFKAAVHGHAFVTDRGVSHKCSVEYAPFQRVPKTTSKKDPREGTIEQGMPLNNCSCDTVSNHCCCCAEPTAV